MMTVHEVSRLAGVSIRTLQYYDKIGFCIRRDTPMRVTGCMTMQTWNAFSIFYCSVSWSFRLRISRQF